MKTTYLHITLDGDEICLHLPPAIGEIGPWFNDDATLRPAYKNDLHGRPAPGLDRPSTALTLPAHQRMQCRSVLLSQLQLYSLLRPIAAAESGYLCLR